MPGDANIRLVLFFTRDVSLRTWDDVGLFAREVALYRRLQPRGVHVTFVTYGDERDLAYAARIPGIDICCNAARIPWDRDAGLPPWLPDETLQAADLIKTNQIRGADVARLAADRWNKPLIARGGYLWSELTARRDGPGSPAHRESLEAENRAFGAAARIVVTTEAMKADVLRRFPARASAVRVIPNGVDVDAFQPAGRRPHESRRLGYVGRLEQTGKNVRALLDVLRSVDEVAVDVVGNGPLRRELEAAAACDPRLRVLGKVDNDRLPGVLRQWSGFVFPSLYEGHPKALIEAMACGLPVVAMDVPGVRNLVRHGETGWLCPPDSASLCEGVRTVLGDAALADRLGRAARDFASRAFSLERVADAELALYREVVEAEAGEPNDACRCGH